MNYFESTTKYYIIDILDRNNVNLQLGDNEVFRLKETNLSNYIKENFPLLDELEKKRLRMSNNLSKATSEKYIEHCQLMSYAFQFLNIPEHLLAKSYNDSSIILEPVSNTPIYDSNEDISELESRRVSDTDLGAYYINDYARKVRNFFYPSFITRNRAKLTMKELMKERELNVKIKRKLLKQIGKGMSNNDN